MVLHAVGGEQLLINPAFLHAQPVIAVPIAGKIDYRHDAAVVLRPAAEHEQTGLRIVRADPLEALPVGVVFPQLAGAQIKQIQIVGIPLHPPVGIVIRQLPVQPLVTGPRGELTKFTAHKQQLLARMRHLEAQHGAQSRKFLVIGAG